MGDYSRDTFRLTNALHQLLSGLSVPDARHYTGVRMQQGVPLLDADWNELEDIRSMELRAILRYFIGEGVPAGNEGFQITASGINNNFAIGPGLMLINGLPVINLSLTTYSDQPLNTGLPPLTTPAGGIDRIDVVYLDVWHEEVSGTGSIAEDPRLVNEQIGIETARRIWRVWQVRVREGAQDLSGLVPEDGHSYLMLARMHRLAGASSVMETMIVDLRRRGLTVAEHLKIPISLRRGIEVLNVERFGQMLRGLRTSLFERLRNGLLPYQTVTTTNETLVLMSLQELMNRAQVGEVQTFSRNLDNTDALRFMNDLYDAQDAWLGILNDLGNEAGTAQEFIDEYRDRLNGDPARLIKGVKPALDQDDLLATVIAQENLNLWLTAPTGNLPEGSVDAIYVAAIPIDEPLTVGNSYIFTYQVVANFISPLADEDFTVQVTLPSAFGTATIPSGQSTLSFSPPGEEAMITVTVTPSGGASNADLDISVFAVRNATLRSSQPPISLSLGSLPPVAAFFYYAGARLNDAGRLEIPQNHLTRPQGRNILFRLRNASPSENRTYQVTRHIIPDVADPSDWSPLVPAALPLFEMAPDSTTDVLARVDGPKAPAPGPPVGTIGDIVAMATLTAIDGAPPAESQELTVTIPFVVV
jgi:hypothetical protein